MLSIPASGLVYPFSKRLVPNERCVRDMTFIGWPTGCASRLLHCADGDARCTRCSCPYGYACTEDGKPLCYLGMASQSVCTGTRPLKCARGGLNGIFWRIPRHLMLTWPSCCGIGGKGGMRNCIGRRTRETSAGASAMMAQGALTTCFGATSAACHVIVVGLDPCFFAITFNGGEPRSEKRFGT